MCLDYYIRYSKLEENQERSCFMGLPSEVHGRHHENFREIISKHQITFRLLFSVLFLKYYNEKLCKATINFLR